MRNSPCKGRSEGQELRQGQCDWRVDREEEKGDNEAGGQIMPDLVGHAKDLGLYLESDVIIQMVNSKLVRLEW